MVGISQFFNRHMKTRIALQLVLDGLPFMLGMSQLLFYLAGNDLILVSRWIGHMIVGGLFAFYVLSIPLTVLSLWMRSRIEDRMEHMPVVRCLSAVFETISIFITALALPVSIPFTAACISSLFSI